MVKILDLPDINEPEGSVKIKIYPKIYGLLALILLSELSPVFAFLNDQIIAYYNFEESSGNLLDRVSIGVTNNMTNSGVAYQQAGKNGYAYTYNNGDESQNISNFVWNTSATGAMSFSMWIKPTTTIDNEVFLMNVHDAGYSTVSLRFITGNKIRLQIGTGSANKQLDSILTVSAGNWYHIVASYNRANSSMKLYINGTKVEYTNFTDMGALISDLVLGNAYDLGTTYDYNGLMDEVAIFNRQLSDGEVNDLFTQYYPFGYYPNTTTVLYDNSTTHLASYNTNITLNISSYDTTTPTLQTLTANVSGIGGTYYIKNFTSWQGLSLNLSDPTISNHTAFIWNPLNTSLNLTAYLQSTAYSLGTPLYNTTILNGTSDIIGTLLTTRVLNNNQTASVSIEIDGANTTITNSSNWYNATINLTTNLVIEQFPFKIWLNNSYDIDNVLSYKSGTISVTNLQFDNCSTYTTRLLNITIKNEKTRTTLINSSLITSINQNGTYFLISQYNTTIFGICINNTVNFTADMDFNFYATGWGATDKREREHFYFNIPLNSTTIQQSFYKLTEAYATKIIFEVVNNVQQPLQNYYITLKRWYGDGYETVAMAKTDVNGQAVTYVELNDPYYAIDILDNDGNLIYETDRIILTSSPMSIIVSTGAIPDYVSRTGDFDYSNTWDNSTEYFSTTMTNINGIDSTFELQIYSLNGSKICNETSGATSSWTTSCLVSNWNSSIFLVIGKGTTNEGTVLIYNYYIDDTILIESVNTPTENIVGLFLIMLIITMAIAGTMPNFLPLAPGLSLLVSNVLMITTIDITIIGGLFVAGIAFLFWFMRS